ncbi:MAG TPA: DnaJ domain-containing protein [Spirochaetota bacterium]|nr:DnaJ domain-containing protein [Spirochaetota bacterium]HOL57513.1 DnaJ domain-containing protein [Spirochaetota bacterium]HPP04083.1 DnaJ domain-containing protein [Spirochaetota bacterium]
MILTGDDLKFIYFATHTSLNFNEINKIASFYDNIVEVINTINKKSLIDRERDWFLYDYLFKKNNLFYGKKIVLLKESEIKKWGIITHVCDNGYNYLLQIIENHAFCKNCCIQFFPKIWWDHPNRMNYSYTEIKYFPVVKTKKPEISKEYYEKLMSYGVDERILDLALSVMFSENELEYVLNTRNYDKINPPPAVNIHSKLIFAYNLWKVRPVKNIGTFSKFHQYFFHNCLNGNIKILFSERYFYPWCPDCLTKFIPEDDYYALDNFKNRELIKTFLNYDFIKNDNKIVRKKHITSFDFLIDYNLSILNLSRDCSIENIKDSFRKLSKIYHPDAGGDPDMFKQILKAKNWLIKNYSLFKKEVK